MYKITKGQLITIWIFGLVLWIFSFFNIGSYSTNKLMAAIFWLLPEVVVFYSLGWFNSQKKDSDK